MQRSPTCNYQQVHYRRARPRPISSQAPPALAQFMAYLCRLHLLPQPRDGPQVNRLIAAPAVGCQARPLVPVRLGCVSNSIDRTTSRLMPSYRAVGGSHPWFTSCGAWRPHVRPNLSWQPWQCLDCSNAFVIVLLQCAPGPDVEWEPLTIKSSPALPHTHLHHRMHWMASPRPPEPSLLMNLQPMMCTRQFTPATPSALLPTAPMVPAPTSHSGEKLTAMPRASQTRAPYNSAPHTTVPLPIPVHKTVEGSTCCEQGA
jgi:hypothetical protein